MVRQEEKERIGSLKPGEENPSKRKEGSTVLNDADGSSKVRTVHAQLA